LGVPIPCRELSGLRVDRTIVGMTDTADVIERFNAAFVHHDGAALDDLIGYECVMEAVEPAIRQGRHPRHRRRRRWRCG
jgi:hypothetical protein